MIGKLALVIGLVVAAEVAQAGTVYRNVVGQGDVVEFMDSKPKWCPIPEGTLQVVWTVNAGPRKGDVVQGCYVIRGDLVYMAFQDGDQYAVPLAKIQELHNRGGV